MNIQDALKETGKAEDENNPCNGKTGYVGWFEGQLYWFDKVTHTRRHTLSHEEIAKGIYEPYHDKKEIRPEKAGELWIFVDEGGEVPFFTTEAGPAFPVNNHLVIRNRSGLSIEIEAMSLGKIIHNQNGWTLLYSPDKEVMKRLKEVEDENVERIEIEDMYWLYTNGYTIPVDNRRIEGTKKFDWKSLSDKSSGKMILEFPKEDS